MSTTPRLEDAAVLDPRKRAILARLRHAYANVETMTRAELIAFCAWNDSNGSFTDEAAKREFGQPYDTEALRDMVRGFRDEDPALAPNHKGQS